MKTKQLAFVCMLLLFVSPILLAEEPKKEIAIKDAMRAFCGTWIMVSNVSYKKHVSNQNETFLWYAYGKKEAPAHAGTFQIEKAWEGPEGNIWCIIWWSFKGNSWTLTRISEDGNVLEHVQRFIRNRLPTEIDSNDEQYLKLIKNKNE